MEIAFVLVRSQIGHEMEVMNDILMINGVKEVIGTFGQYDIFVKVQSPLRKEIERIVTKEIRSIPNVISTNTLPVMPRQDAK